jgi:HD superfamily phosphohydrolase
MGDTIGTVWRIPSSWYLREGRPRIDMTEAGWHAAEGLIVARYFMFAQVYFHKMRVIYDRACGAVS